MTRVEVREVPRPAQTDPEITVRFSEEPGCSSSALSWNSDVLVSHLRRMFFMKEHEDLTHVVVDKSGIRAYFKTKTTR